MSEFDHLLGGDSDVAATLSAQELGDIIGLSERTVRDLAKRGVLAKVGARFEMRDSVFAYCAHLREQASGRSNSGTLTQERIRVAREQADALALKNAVARGEMVPAIEVESLWGNVLRDVRSAMLAIPTRVQQRLVHLTQHDVSEIDLEVRSALQEAAQ